MAISLVLQFLFSAALLQGGDTGLIEEFDASLPRTGSVTLMMSPSQVLGPKVAAELNHLLLADEMIEWIMYVPDHYSPNRPPGVIVFVPSLSRGALPDQWQSLMDEKNLIWIGTRDAGASVPVNERVLRAVFAPYAIADRYKVDQERVYVAGYEDGGKVANLVQSTDPVTFKGGLYICGAHFWGEHTPDKLDTVLANRHVFIGGCAGTDKRDVIRVYDNFVDAGADNTHMITMQSRQGWLPHKTDIEEAIDFLDGAEPNTQFIEESDE